MYSRGLSPGICGIDSIEAVRGIMRLKYLDCELALLTSREPLLDLPALQISCLRDNQITDMSPLGSLVTSPPVSLEFDFIELRPGSEAGMNLANLLLDVQSVAMQPQLRSAKTVENRRSPARD